MANADMHGGRTPYAEVGALTGPARFVIAPTTVAVPGDLSDVTQMYADADGEYPPKTGWLDLGLTADAGSTTHGRDSSGLEYQQPVAALFQAITAINRTITIPMAHIDEFTLQVMENAQAASTVAAGPGKSAQKKLYVGNYNSVPQWRVVMIAYRPSGAGGVIEPVGSPTGTRPPCVGRCIPRATLSSDDTELSIGRGDPASMSIVLTAESEPTAPAGGEHGFWLIEQEGTIAAAS